MLAGESGQPMNHPHETSADDFQGFADQDQVRVVGNIATRSSQMDDRSRIRTSIAVGMNVSHHVVTELAFVLASFHKVDVVDVGPKLFDLQLRNCQTQVGFGLGQGHPQPSPGTELPLGAPQFGHFTRGVAANQRIIVHQVTSHQVFACSQEEIRFGLGVYCH